MNKKVLTLSAVMASMLFGAAAHAADTRIGVTIYKYDDNFMSVVRKAIEQDAKAAPDVQLLMNDSQNDQSKQNDQIDVLLAKGVKALAINLVDPAAAGTVIEKARGQNVPVVFFNKEPSRKALDSYDKAYYVGTDSKESGIIQGDLIAKHWAANQGWDLNKDGQIQFVLLKGEPGHPDAEARTTYVIKELNDKGIKTEQLQLDTAMWDTAQAKDKMDAWLSGPNANKIEVVIANNDAMAMGAVEALKAHNKSSIPVFGVDALPEALALVKSGALAGTVLNDANNQAKATFDLAKNLADGKGAADGTNWKIDNKVIRAKLVIGADGANSQVRQMAGIGVHAWQYAQSCMLISVQCENDPGDSTWQQFTPDGPRAFLPLFDNWASLVWYDSPARIRQLQNMNMAQLQAEIAKHFPSRLGYVTPLAAGAFPLTRRHALQYVQPGLALVGDAAHTIHPLAGQGVNLGYRDVDALIDVLVNARSYGEAWASYPVLKRYQMRRMADNFIMQSGMDLFYAGFSNNLPPLRFMRNLGLMAAERAGVLKRQALKYALGL